MIRLLWITVEAFDHLDYQKVFGFELQFGWNLLTKQAKLEQTVSTLQ